MSKDLDRIRRDVAELSERLQRFAEHHDPCERCDPTHGPWASFVCTPCDNECKGEFIARVTGVTPPCPNCGEPASRVCGACLTRAVGFAPQDEDDGKYRESGYHARFCRVRHGGPPLSEGLWTRGDGT